MPTKQIYMVIGCPGSGKSWVCAQLRDRFAYVPHDDTMGAGYVGRIADQSKTTDKPLLIETPFSISQIKDPLEKQGFHVVPVFILEKPSVIRERYKARENKDIPEGHLTRQNTYMERATKWGSFFGTSAAVLEYLKNAAPPAKEKYPWQT